MVSPLESVIVSDRKATISDANEKPITAANRKNRPRAIPGESQLRFMPMLSAITLSSGETIVNTFYDPTPVYAAAGSAAALFGAMTFVGFTTKADLTKMGTYLFIGLIGIIIASVINIFIGSDGLSFIISILGVIIFTGLTAYDTQKIKEMSMNPQIANGGNLALKFSVMGALTLYLDLLNLFLFLLSIFGGRE